MKTSRVVKMLLFAGVLFWTLLTFSGCTNANSLSSENPVGSETDPESIINDDDDQQTKSENFAPVLNLMVDREVVGPDSEVIIRAETLDPEGGQVEVTWDADIGDLINTAVSRAVWKAPDHGATAKISCTAEDINGLKTESEVQIEVLANGVYQLRVMADRSAIQTAFSEDAADNLYIPVSGAKVELPALGKQGVTNNDGLFEFNIDQTQDLATSAKVLIDYLDWKVDYNATLKTRQGASTVMDSLSFSPGFDGVSIAVGRGDSFSMKRGAVEVTTLENSSGEIKPVSEVTVDAGSVQSISSADTGLAFVNSVSASKGKINLRLAKTGYQTVDGYYIPVAADGLTLVRAQLEKVGKIPDSDAIISYTKPYNYQKSFPVSGPFEIGFGQPMEKDGIFDDLSLMIQNKDAGSMLAVNGAEIEDKFRVEWIGSTILRLYPKKLLQGLTRYSLLISQWSARSADGRILKNYNGMYGEFITDEDASPQLLSTSPVNGDSEVGRTGPFIMEFNRKMNVESLYDDLEIEITNLDSNSIIFIDGENLKSHFSVTWKNDNSVLELVPYRMLAPETEYLLQLNKSGLISDTGKKVAGFAGLWGQFKTGGL
ncbi:MAG: Ig-like domain-containing protein [Candidatus Rifleibacteriota bacterium]